MKLTLINIFSVKNMDDKKLLIICISVILVVAIIAAAFVAYSNMKEDSKIAITSNKTLYNGSSLSIKLTDLNKTPISNGTINVTITDKNGKEVIKETIKSNSKGVAKLKLKLKKGKYTVNASFEGNDNYTGNSSTQKLTIKEAVAKVESSGSSSSYSSGNNLEGPETDSLGITREEAMRAEQISGQDVKYDAESGMYVQYDPVNGVYHN